MLTFWATDLRLLASADFFTKFKFGFYILLIAFSVFSEDLLPVFFSRLIQDDKIQFTPHLLHRYCPSSDCFSSSVKGVKGKKE